MCSLYILSVSGEFARQHERAPLSAAKGVIVR